MELPHPGSLLHTRNSNLIHTYISYEYLSTILFLPTLLHLIETL